MSEVAALPAFFLVNPVSRRFHVYDRFNAPRNYTFAPTKKQLHEGIDLAATDSQGNPVAVLAAQRGVVDYVGFAPQGYGNHVRIVHRWGDQTYVTWYGHLSAVTARVGQFVLAGQKIGIAGTTGFSTGVHLHLTLQHLGHGLSGYVVDDVVDPEPYFLFQNIPQFDELSYVADVTIPDGTEMQAGQAFTKTWRVRNTGSRTWDARYKFVFVGDARMNGPEEVALPSVPIAPGQQVNLSVPLTAPAEAGTHRSTWQLRGPDGLLIPHTVYAEIVVPEARPYDRAEFVEDVTVPDGEIVQPGETFVKIWRVRNAGSTTWTPDYTLRHVADERMDGPEQVLLGETVRPGEELQIEVRLTAPREPGRHRSTWMFHNARGERFDYDLYAEIQVPARAEQGQQLDELSYVADVTVPDGETVQPGVTFIKTWRVRNSGASTWGEGYELAFFGDERMGGPQAVALPPLAPGETGEVSVQLTAPRTAGSYRSTWKGRNPQGKFFEYDLYALIEVPEVAQQLDELSYVADVTVPDGAVMHPGTPFVKTWRVRNTGTSTWGEGYELAFFGDERMGGPQAVPLPPLAPGETGEVSVQLTAPQSPALYRSTWKGRDPQGRFFEYDLFALIDVSDPEQTFDMLDFVRGDGRVYELAYDWDGGGRQRVQTQVEGARFYYVKGREWEELWADARFIYRGTDTSAGHGEVYTLFSHGQYGSPWMPRKMTVGKLFYRSPTVVFRRKSDGAEIPDKHFVHKTWLKLEAVRRYVTLSSGVELRDVAVLAAYEDVDGKPAAQPFERYTYAKGYGLVAWEGELGRSALAKEFPRGSVPDNEREPLPWLDSIR